MDQQKTLRIGNALTEWLCVNSSGGSSMSTAKNVVDFPSRKPEGVVVADLKDGYTKTANEIQKMKPKLKMAGREWQVLEAIIWLTYGWNKKQDRVTNTVIAELTGLEDTHVSNAIKTLSDRKVITCIKQGSMKLVGVNKVVSEWILDKPKSVKILPKTDKKLPESVKTLPESVATQYKNKNNILKDILPKNSDEFSGGTSNESDSFVQQEEQNPEVFETEQPNPVEPAKPVKPIETAKPDDEFIPITGAAIQTPKGGKWGSSDDLKAAEYIFEKAQATYPPLKTPNWADWANTVRLMNQCDGHTHREICELMRFANQDAFWTDKILCPRNLRKHWQTLCAQRKAKAKQPEKHAKAESEREYWERAIKSTDWAKNIKGW